MDIHSDKRAVEMEIKYLFIITSSFMFQGNVSHVLQIL